MATGQRGAERKLRFAHIGLELDGAWWSVKAALEDPDLQFVGIAEPKHFLLDLARRRADPLGLVLPLRDGIRLFTDFVQMLDQVKPDIANVYSPLSEHLAVVRECARRKIHCWVQKPAALTGPDAREMERLARDSGIVLVVSDFQLARDAVLEVARRVERGDVGDVTKVFSIHGFSGQKDHGCSRWYKDYFYDVARHGGGALMDQTTYAIARVMYILGSPLSVFALTPTIKTEPQPGGPVEDDALVILEYPRAQGICAGSWAYPNYGIDDIQVFGLKGSIYLMDGTIYERPSMADMSQPRTEYQRVDIPPAHVPTMKDYVLRGLPLARLHSPGFMARVNEVVDAAYESARTRRAIPLA